MANNTPYTPDINNDSADFIPAQGDYKTLQPFRYWCQKVLPLVYDDSLSYYELLCKVVDYLNKTMEDVETLHDDVDDLHTAYGQLQGYVNTSITDLRTDYQNLVNYVNGYFASLDVQNEINNKLDAMALNGSLTALMTPYIPNAVAVWMNEHLTPTSPVVDNTLTVSGAAADAKVTGDRIDALQDVSDAAFGVRETLTNGKTHDLPDVREERTYANWCTLLIPAAEGDVFYVQGYGGNNSRLWVFADTNGASVEASPVNTHITDYVKLTAPTGTSYFAFNSKTNEVGYTPAVIYGENLLFEYKDNIDITQAMKNGLEDSFYSSLTWQNGTPMNILNENFISLKEYLPSRVTKRYYVQTNISLNNGETLYAYVYSKNAGGSMVKNEFVPTVNGNTFSFELSDSEVSFNVAIRKDLNGTPIPLRITTVDTAKIYFSSLPLYVNSLPKNIYPREIQAYLGMGGNFVFKHPTLVQSGRIPFRFGGSGNLNIYIPSVYPQPYFSTDAIISQLTSDDVVTENGVSWIALRADYMLVFNLDTYAFSTKYAGSALKSNEICLITAHPSQLTDGLLYGIYLKSRADYLIEQSNANRELDEPTKAIKNARHIYNNGGTPLTILHLSDIHAATSEYNRIVKQLTSYGDLIDEAICTGDMVANEAGAIASWWNPNILTCIGNHDTASYNESTGYDWTALSMADRDAYYIAPFESNWDIEHTAGTSYYYKDYATQHVRLIVMDAMLYNDNGAEATAQTAWLANLLSDAITNSLHVLIAIHSGHGGSTVETCTFSQKGYSTYPTYSDCNTPQAVIDTVATAITGGLHFIGYLCGHEHKDFMLDAENDGKQMMYLVTCAIDYAPKSDQARGVGLDAYNVVTIDTANTLVRIVRGGGADITNAMTSRKGISFNYSTGEIVGQIE